MKKYIVFSALLLLVFCVLLVRTGNDKLNFKQRYDIDTKRPFDTKILYDTRRDIFPDSETMLADYSIYQVLNDYSGAKANYIFIACQKEVDKESSDKLLEWVHSGNNVFVASERIGSIMKYVLDSLNVESTVSMYMPEIFIKDHDSAAKQVEMNFTSPHLKRKENYLYPGYPLLGSFSDFDSSSSKIIGRFADGKINFLKVRYGDGDFYFHTVPLAFTNLNCMYDNNFDYMYKALSCLPKSDLIWDRYYKFSFDPNNRVSTSMFRYILSQEALQYMYWTALALLLLYLIFRSKRRQRIIPVLAPYRNTTLDFTYTIARLFLEKKNHKNIATKKILYFSDFLRQKVHFKVNIASSNAAKLLSEKTAVPIEEILILFRLISITKNSDSITEDELIKLNEKIEQFYEKVNYDRH